MVGIEPVLPGSSHGNTIANVEYIVYSIISLMWPWFTLDIVVGRVAACVYNSWIISHKGSWYGSPLIVGRVLMKNLATTSPIFSGFNIVYIIVFSFFIRTSLLYLSFVGGVVDHRDVFVQLGLKILLSYIKHLLLTLTQIIMSRQLSRLII